jgi:cell wall-associated NlpC family hydrolase
MANVSLGGGKWTEDQIANAQTIIDVGQRLGASQRDIQIALMTALVESGLHNVNYGDRDSLGLFQQRSAWGSVEQRLDPAESARMFFTGGHGGQRGLFDFANRDQMSMGQAAQAVQVSAYPDRYAKQAGNAADLLGIGPGRPKGRTLADIPDITSMVTDLKQRAPQMPTQASVPQVNDVGAVTADASGLGAAQFPGSDPSNPSDSSALDALTFDNAGPTNDPMSDLHAPSLSEFGLDHHLTTSTTITGADGQPIDFQSGPVSGWRKQVVNFAHQMLGTPYVWGGETMSGVDCSGLVQMAFKHAGIDQMPRVTYTQVNQGKRTAIKNLVPGDLVFWDNEQQTPGPDHVAIYVGKGMVIEAPRPGENVQLSHLYDLGQAFGVHLPY